MNRVRFVSPAFPREEPGAPTPPPGKAPPPAPSDFLGANAPGLFTHVSRGSAVPRGSRAAAPQRLFIFSCEGLGTGRGVAHPVRLFITRSPAAPEHFASRNPGLRERAEGGGVPLGARMNPRPLEPAATCPQAKALTPGAQATRTRRLRSAPPTAPAPRKSPPSDTGSDTVPAGPGGRPRGTAPPPPSGPPWRGSGRPARSPCGVTGGSALPRGLAPQGVLRERPPLGPPRRAGGRSGRVPPEPWAPPPPGDPEERGWPPRAVPIGPRPMEDLKLALRGTLG